jgi:hypothetical protein
MAGMAGMADVVAAVSVAVVAVLVVAGPLGDGNRGKGYDFSLLYTIATLRSDGFGDKKPSQIDNRCASLVIYKGDHGRSIRAHYCGIVGG